MRTQELEQRGQLRIPSAFPSSGEGQGEEYAPCLASRRSRACVAARPGKKTPQLASLVAGDWLGCLRSLTAMRARFRAFQHGQQSQDMTSSACRFWRGLCVRAGSILPVVSQVLWSRRPGSQARVKPKAQAGRRKLGLDLSKERLNTGTRTTRATAGYLRPFLPPVRGGVRPLSRHHVGNRACVAARPEKTPQLTLSCCRGD